MLRNLNGMCHVILDFSLKTRKCYSLIARNCISAQGFSVLFCFILFCFFFSKMF